MRRKRTADWRRTFMIFDGRECPVHRLGPPRPAETGPEWMDRELHRVFGNGTVLVSATNGFNVPYTNLTKEEASELRRELMAGADSFLRELRDRLASDDEVPARQAAAVRA